MDFSIALALLKQGHSITREGWNGKGLSLRLQNPDASSKMTLPYVYLEYPMGGVYPTGARVPWLASQTDLLANDWVVIAPAKAPQTAQEAPKRRGRPKGASKASKPAQRDPEAPHGRKADGTPRKPPGRRKVDVVMHAPPEQVAEPPAQ
jgi:hypothetical protein